MLSVSEPIRRIMTVESFSEVLRVRLSDELTSSICDWTQRRYAASNYM